MKKKFTMTADDCNSAGSFILDHSVPTYQPIVSFKHPAIVT